MNFTPKPKNQANFNPYNKKTDLNFNLTSVALWVNIVLLTDTVFKSINILFEQ